jgi:hypothetical protein
MQAAVLRALCYCSAEGQLGALQAVGEMQRCELGEITLQRRATAAAAHGIARPHLVSTSVFRMQHGYRDSAKYAAGLLRLAHAITTHLPDFSLRVYMDGSLDEAAFARDASVARTARRTDEAAGLEKQARVWREVLAQLSAMPFVQVVTYSWPRYAAADSGGHVDLLGTLMRFIPLFRVSQEAAAADHAAPSGAGQQALPEWAGSPGDGAIVFVTDVDFADLTTEHTYLHLVRWFARAVAAAATAGPAGVLAGVAAGSSGCAAEPLPQLVTMCTAGSAAPRHLPDCGMPPFIAYCVAARTRFPAAWLTDFLADCARQAPHLATRYCADLHDPRARNFTYTKRKVEMQKSPFPFGIDEFFLTAVLKLRAVAAPSTRDWLFLALPNIDIVLIKCISLVGAALEADTSAWADPALRRILSHAAAAAGDAASEAQIAAGSTGGKTPATLVAAWRATWPEAAGKRIAMFSAFPGRFLAAVPSVALPLLASIRATVAATVDAVGAGKLPHKEEDVEVLLQNLQHLSSMGGEPLVAHVYRVGEGHVERVAGSPHSAALVADLAAARDCAVPLPSLEHVGYKRVWKERQGAPGTQPDPVVAAALVAAARADAAAGAAGGGGGEGAGALPEHAAPPPTAAGAEARGVPVAGMAETPAGTAAATAQPPPGWTLHVSRSTGRQYYFLAATNESAWHDDTLPAGWAWRQTGPDGPGGQPAPREYIHLASGARSGERPVKAITAEAAMATEMEDDADGCYGTEGRATGQKRRRLGE